MNAAPPKRRLTPAIIVEAALRLADREGLAHVTIRRVAAEVEGAPMSLYRHFRNKDALLDGMLDAVIAQLFAVDDGDGTWQAEVLGVARQAHRVLGEHPAWLPLLQRLVAPPTALGGFERLAATMGQRKRTLSERALHAVTALMCFTLGFVLVERMMRRADGTVVPVEQLRRGAEATGAGIHPRLSHFAKSFAAWSFDEAFESGIHSLVDEIDAARVA